ncbi:hypothetical protein JTB14_019455 [Gonioctena quinquepunctata]|nr:hypothetical protein JTB14_019455 [Gonioctena quinquepunctata]
MNHDFKEKCNGMLRYKSAHNTLLHVERQNRGFETRQNRNRSTHHTITEKDNNSNKKEVLLATALVSSLLVTGMPQLLRVLIDQGSQISPITEEAAQMLGLPRQKIRAEITGVGENETIISKWKITARIKPRFPSKFILNSELLVLPKIMKALPNHPCQILRQINSRITFWQTLPTIRAGRLIYYWAQMNMEKLFWKAEENGIWAYWPKHRIRLDSFRTDKKIHSNKLVS